MQRLLKGHPNIVHFIDASWHKLPNGSFEVFILMEYCPGKAHILVARKMSNLVVQAAV